jgi:hypothetical protein
MNTSNNQTNKSNGWKILIASLSVTSLFGLVNIFSNKDAAKTGSSSNVDALLNLPIPTLVPAAAITEKTNTGAPALRTVAQPVPTAVAASKPPVIEKVVVGGGSSGSSGPSTSTSSSRK